MSNRQDHLGSRIARRLNQGLGEIDPATLARLRSARSTALERIQIQPDGEISPASDLAFKLGPWRHFNLRYLLPLAAVLVIVSGMGYWQYLQHSDDLVDIDAKLLAGDLPIDAYLDNGLDSWLKR